MFLKSGVFFDLTEKQNRLAALEARQGDASFWSRADEARQVVQEIKALKNWLTPEAELQRRLGDARTMIELLEAEPDPRYGPPCLRDTPPPKKRK